MTLRQTRYGSVAARAGVGVNTVSNLEAARNVSVENLVRIAMVLGRLNKLQELFQPQLNSVKDILRYESQSKHQRIKRKG
ncbi:helix-turn-helix transcriptional regulator [Acinetobacter baumannii]|uniref:helix-turn-helix domain-containing protein n=1 Tax=Acinetobacter baumannii TaxID=470 RepID=UPI001CB7D863|nr:helix-turn-helix transcriptional regulator [Acinetobacter baumannii]